MAKKIVHNLNFLTLRDKN